MARYAEGSRRQPYSNYGHTLPAIPRWLITAYRIDGRLRRYGYISPRNEQLYRAVRAGTPLIEASEAAGVTRQVGRKIVQRISLLIWVKISEREAS